jgi:hypothetical protein
MQRSPKAMLLRPTNVDLQECDCHLPAMESAGRRSRPVELRRLYHSSVGLRRFYYSSVGLRPTWRIYYDSLGLRAILL